MLYKKGSLIQGFTEIVHSQNTNLVSRENILFDVVVNHFFRVSMPAKLERKEQVHVFFPILPALWNNLKDRVYISHRRSKSMSSLLSMNKNGVNMTFAI